jgi:aconitate hydratase
MGTELGATTSIFPSDDRVFQYLNSQGRGPAWIELMTTENEFDSVEVIDLSSLQPLIAMPSSPENIKNISEVAGTPIYQSYIGSSANPGYRDFAIAAEIVKNRHIHAGVSLDINPTSRQILATLDRDGYLLPLIKSGARLHQTGCNGCIGMGQAPATDKISLRTVPRNFPGRSGTPEDKVCLVSPETAAASALNGYITDPRTLGIAYPRIAEPDHPILQRALLEAPLAKAAAQQQELYLGPNIARLPRFEGLPDHARLPILLKTGNDVSTDEILPAGAQVLPFRSNIPKISEFVFYRHDPHYVQRTETSKGRRQHAIIAGENYGQGSSREHAALAPRYLGLVAVVAKSFSRIHWQNLINFGILPLTFRDPQDYRQLKLHDVLNFSDLHQGLLNAQRLIVVKKGTHGEFSVSHSLSPRQIEIVLAGGIINWKRKARDNVT